MCVCFSLGSKLSQPFFVIRKMIWSMTKYHDTISSVIFVIQSHPQRRQTGSVHTYWQNWTSSRTVKKQNNTGQLWVTSWPGHGITRSWIKFSQIRGGIFPFESKLDKWDKRYELLTSRLSHFVVHHYSQWSNLLHILQQAWGCCVLNHQSNVTKQLLWVVRVCLLPQKNVYTKSRSVCAATEG